MGMLTAGITKKSGDTVNVRWLRSKFYTIVRKRYSHLQLIF